MDSAAFAAADAVVDSGCPLDMEAVESPRPAHGGYRSPSSGDLEADAWDLLQSLYEKIREEMPICHVERATHGWQVRPERRLVGRIE